LDLERVTSFLDELKREVYAYNEKVRHTGFYLKPVHLVYKNGMKYIYVGRYWYVLKREKGKIRWIYAGMKKPKESLPDPPAIPKITIVCNGDACEVLSELGIK
jgi:hypothetical protein